MPNLGKRVFQKKVLPNLAHPTEGLRRFGHLDVPNLGKRVFQKKVLPNLAHPAVVPFFKLDVIAIKIKIESI